MTAAEALATIRGLASDASCIKMEGDANGSMHGEAAMPGDVRAALCTATACVASGERWHVTGGLDLDGRALGLVVRLIAGVVDVESVYR